MLTWKYTCLRCNHKWIYVLPPKPWHGKGFDENHKPIQAPPEVAEREGIDPTWPEHPECPQCGNLYVRWLNYKEGK